MSRFVVNFQEQKKAEDEKPSVAREKPVFSGYQNNGDDGNESPPSPQKKRSRLVKVLGVLGILLAAFLLVAGVGGYLYWQSVKRTPQYSLALLVDGARRDDAKQIEQLVDTDAVVDSFVPQITQKAIELYGRNLAPQQISRVKETAAPLMPAIKQRAREELPRVIREKTQPFENVPWWLIALGADRAVEITTQNDNALVKSKIPEREIEVTMKKNGDVWKVVAIKDERLARRIAEKIGQELVAASANKSNVKEAGKKLGVQNLQEMMKKVEEIFK
jgi:hypothetical protein